MSVFKNPFYAGAYAYGKSEQRTPIYNTNGLWLIPIERLADEASSLVAEGDFKAIKIRLGRDSVKDDLKAIAEVHRAVGDDIILMSDFNQGRRSMLRCAGCTSSTIRDWNGSKSPSCSMTLQAPRGLRMS